MQSFRKRIYTPSLFLHDFAFITFRIFKVVDAFRSARIPPAMVEKIMLSVTAVNDCVYCSRFHSIMALANGIDQKEIDALLAVDIQKEVETYESIALIFAQHYAESERSPDPLALKKLTDFYGEKKSSDIMLYIRLILIGNLSGNTISAFWSRLSGKAVDGSSALFELVIVLSCYPLFLMFALFAYIKKRRLKL